MTKQILSWKEVDWAYSKWCEGYTQEQIAEALDVSVKTVHRAFHGRERIRPVLIYDGRKAEA